MSLFRKLCLYLLKSLDGGIDRRAVIIAVKFVEQRPVLTYKGQLGGGGTGVYAKETVPLVF